MRLKFNNHLSQVFISTRRINVFNKLILDQFKDSNIPIMNAQVTLTPFMSNIHQLIICNLKPYNA